MATLATNALTLLDWAKRQDPNGNTADVIEIMNQANAVIEDALALEGNLPTGHRTTQRTSIPTPKWRRINQGVAPGKSTSKQIEDTIGMLEDYSEVDAALMNLNGNKASFRLSEEKAFIEGYAQTVASTLFYGNTASNPDQFNGLAPRAAFNALSSSQVVNGGGGGSDNTSIWWMTWDEATCHMVFPKGGKAGLQMNDKGQVTIQKADGTRFEAYQTHYKWDLGLSVRDPRYIARACNIDVSDLANAGLSGYTGAQLINILVDLAGKIFKLNYGRQVIYVNRAVWTALNKLAMSKANVNLTIDMYGGKPTTMFWGVPIKICDAILSTESAIS